MNNNARSFSFGTRVSARFLAIDERRSGTRLFALEKKNVARKQISTNATSSSSNNNDIKDEDGEEAREEKKETNNTLENGIVTTTTATTTTMATGITEKDEVLSEDQPRWAGEPSSSSSNTSSSSSSAKATERAEAVGTSPPPQPATTSGYTRKWKKRDLSWARDAIPFYVMLPLDVVSRDGVLENKEVLEVALDALARVGVDGVSGGRRE